MIGSFGPLGKPQAGSSQGSKAQGPRAATEGLGVAGCNPHPPLRAESSKDIYKIQKGNLNPKP